jgi:hypothetical protein
MQDNREGGQIAKTAARARSSRLPPPLAGACVRAAMAPPRRAAPPPRRRAAASPPLAAALALALLACFAAPCAAALRARRAAPAGEGPAHVAHSWATAPVVPGKLCPPGSVLGEYVRRHKMMTPPNDFGNGGGAGNAWMQRNWEPHLRCVGEERMGPAGDGGKHGARAGGRCRTAQDGGGLLDAPACGCVSRAAAVAAAAAAAPLARATTRARCCVRTRPAGAPRTAAPRLALAGPFCARFRDLRPGAADTHTD